MPCIADADGQVQIRVRVQPRASKDAVAEEHGGRLRIRLTAPPVDGAANEALRAFIAKQLGVSKGAVSLASGERSRDKTLNIRGLTASEARCRLLRGDSGRRI
jgi:hypothetical protein